jgi:hypothetical protein
MQASGLRGGSEGAPPIAASYSAISGTGSETAASKYADEFVAAEDMNK